MCQGFSQFPGLLPHVVVAKLATSSIRVEDTLYVSSIYRGSTVVHTWTETFEENSSNRVIFNTDNAGLDFGGHTGIRTYVHTYLHTYTHTYIHYTNMPCQWG